MVLLRPEITKSNVSWRCSNDRQFDGRCHIWGKFVGVTAIDAANGIFSGIAKGLGNLGGSEPGLAIVWNDGEVGVMKADGVHGVFL